MAKSINLCVYFAIVTKTIESGCLARQSPETIPGMRPLIQAGRCILYLATGSNDLKFVGDYIEDITVTCFGLLASYQALSDHGVANDLNLVGDSVAKHLMESSLNCCLCD